MHYTISGEIAQSVRFEFEANETLWASTGSIMTYSKGVEWALRVPGGIGGAISRTLAGEGISLSYIQSREAEQYLLLASGVPGHIAVWNLADGPVVTTRGSFLAAWGADVDIAVTTARRAGAAFFGGVGLFLQRISGQGTVLVHGSGDFYERPLAAGEQMMVSTGHLAAFADSVDYDIQRVGGIRKAMFGGEGLFMTRLTGPGRVLLQTLKRNTVTASQSG
jgi:uncharacterized protein (TIGR00266 family)